MMYRMHRETVDLIRQAEKEFPDEFWAFWPDDWKSEEIFRDDVRRRMKELREKQDNL